MPSSSNSNAKSAGLDGTVYTSTITPTTLSSPKNDLESDGDNFDYHTILDGNNIKTGVYSADAEQHKAMHYCPCDLFLYSLSELLQSQISQDDNANISHNRSKVLSMSNSNISEKDNIGQKQLWYQVVDDVEEERVEDFGKEEYNMNSSSNSSESNDNYNNDDNSTNQDSNEGSWLAKWYCLYRPCSEPNDDTSNASTMLRSTELGEPQLVDRVTDAGQEWEIYSIIGRQKVNSVVQYWVEWEPTWMLESELIGARELVHEFEAWLQVLCKNTIEQGKSDNMCKTQLKRWQGWP